MSFHSMTYKLLLNKNVVIFFSALEPFFGIIFLKGKRLESQIISKCLEPIQPN